MKNNQKICCFFAVWAMIAWFSIYLVADNFPGFDYLFKEAFLYELTDDYEVLRSKKSSLFSNMLFQRSEWYEIELSEHDFQNLIDSIESNGRWKRQPNLGFKKHQSFKEWERLIQLDQYGLNILASVRSDSRIISISYSKY